MSKARLQLLERAPRDEDVDPSLEGGERSLSPELHLYVDEEIPWTFDLSVEVDGARVGVQLPGAEVVLLVALRDGDDDVVSGVGGRRSDAEDLSRDDDVGLEAEVVVGDSQRGVLAVHVVRTADPLTTSVGHFAVVWRTGEREAAVSSLYIIARLG